jgi:hypothetical protein
MSAAAPAPAARADAIDDNPIRREIERRKREAVVQEKPYQVQAIKSIQKDSRTATVLIIVGVAVVVAAAALVTLHVTNLFKLF